MKRGKKYQQAASHIDSEKRYDPAEACQLVGKTRIASFDESVDIAVNLGVDPRHADQQVRGVVALPHGTGKDVRVAVFAKGAAATQAKEAGADVVGGDELAQRVEQGFLEFDRVVAAPDMMAAVGKLGRVLGPRGLMPNPKLGTVTPDVATAVKRLKAGQVEFRVEKAGIVHAGIGRASFQTEQLLDNFKALFGALSRAKPQAAKGQYVKSVTLSCTMGPNIPVDPHKALESTGTE
ncbi:MAG: 50S ribosomal protein L1 [Myxococcota bacterium]